MDNLDIFLSPIENQWRDRIARAQATIDSRKSEWTENLELYNGRRKHKEQRAYEYYANIIYQIYKTDKSQVCPLGLDFYAELDSNDRASQENMLVSSLLNNQLASFENVKVTRKLHTQTSCKGVGIALISIDSDNSYDSVEVEGEENAVAKGTGNKIRLTVKKTEDVLYDTKTTDDFESLPWVAAAYTITAQEFRESDEYSNKTDVLKINGIPIDNPWTDGALYTNIIKQEDMDGGYKDPRFGGIRIWEVWDTLDRKKYHIESKSYKVVKEEEYPVDSKEFNFPFVFLSFTDEDVDELPPTPEVSLLKDAQEAFNKIRSAQVRDVKRGVRHLVYNKRVFTNNDIAKLTDSDKDQVIPYDDTPIATTGPIPANNLIWQVPDLQPMPDAHNMATAILGDIQQTSGYGPMERAGLPSTGTATETNTIAGFMADRRRAKLYEILNFWQRVAKKSLVLIAKFWPDTVVVNTGSVGQKAVWKELKKTILNKDYCIKVYVGSEGIIDRQRRASEDMQIANITFPIIQAVGGDATYLLRKILALREWTPEEIDALFKNTKEQLMKIAELRKKYMEGQNDPQAATVLFGALDQYIMDALSPADMAELQGKFKASGGKAPTSRATPSVDGQRESMLAQDLGKGL